MKCSNCNAENSDEANIIIYGNDLELIKNMEKSFKDKDIKKSVSTPQSKPITSQTTSPTPPSISI